MVKIELDFAYCDPLRDVLKRIAAQNGTILSFVAEGPAGGNPCLTLGFPTTLNAVAFIQDHDPDELDLHLSHIEDVA